jgi:hypothetical protein
VGQSGQSGEHQAGVIPEIRLDQQADCRQPDRRHHQTKTCGKQKLAAMAYVPIGDTPDECEAFFKSEMDKWGKVIKDAGLKTE